MPFNRLEFVLGKCVPECTGIWVPQIFSVVFEILNIGYFKNRACIEYGYLFGYFQCSIYVMSNQYHCTAPVCHVFEVAQGFIQGFFIQPGVGSSAIISFAELIKAVETRTLLVIPPDNSWGSIPSTSGLNHISENVSLEFLH
jgi:hypothetical protein